MSLYRANFVFKSIVATFSLVNYVTMPIALLWMKNAKTFPPQEVLLQQWFPHQLAWNSRQGNLLKYVILYRNSHSVNYVTVNYVTTVYSDLSQFRLKISTNISSNIFTLKKKTSHQFLCLGQRAKPPYSWKNTVLNKEGYSKISLAWNFVRRLNYGGIFQAYILQTSGMVVG